MVQPFLLVFFYMCCPNSNLIVTVVLCDLMPSNLAEYQPIKKRKKKKKKSIYTQEAACLWRKFCPIFHLNLAFQAFSASPLLFFWKIWYFLAIDTSHHWIYTGKNGRSISQCSNCIMKDTLIQSCNPHEIHSPKQFRGSFWPKKKKFFLRKLFVLED